MIAYHIPAVTHPDSAAFDVLSFVLGDEPTGRLYKALVETKKATSADAGELEVHDPGVFLEIEVGHRERQAAAPQHRRQEPLPAESCELFDDG
jgi:zinc protease